MTGLVPAIHGFAQTSHDNGGGKTRRGGEGQGKELHDRKYDPSIPMQLNCQPGKCHGGGRGNTQPAQHTRGAKLTISQCAKEQRGQNRSNGRGGKGKGLDYGQAV